MIRLEAMLLPDRTAPSRDGAGSRSLDLIVPDGGFRWIVGATGAGKTLVLEVLAARRRPLARMATVLGTDVRRAGRRELAALRRRQGVIRDTPDLVPHLTLGENILLPLVLRGVRPERARRDTLDIADWLGVADRLETLAGAASRGERQLCAVARAVAVRPDLVLADEPSLGLGERDGTRVILLLAELNRLGTTIVVATREEWTRRLHEAPAIAVDAAARAGALVAA